MDVNFIFPGQGSQYNGMGKMLYDKFDFAKHLFNKANDLLEYNLKEICFSKSTNIINETKYTQPAVFIYSMICDYYLKDSHYNPIAFSGHSLGEYSALVSSNALCIEDALNIIKIRSENMNNANQKIKGKMAAILSSDYNKINALIDHLDNNIVIANYNSKNQTIISGEANDIDELIILLKDKKFKVIPLNVSGAFHSPLMKDVKKSLDEIIDKTEFNDILLPIYQNVNPIKNFKSDVIKSNLIKQIISPVKWIDIIKNMYNDKNCTFIEVGPGTVLTKLNKNINSDIICTNFNKLQSTI